MLPRCDNQWRMYVQLIALWWRQYWENNALHSRLSRDSGCTIGLTSLLHGCHDNILRRVNGVRTCLHALKMKVTWSVSDLQTKMEMNTSTRTLTVTYSDNGRQRSGVCILTHGDGVQHVRVMKFDHENLTGDIITQRRLLHTWPIQPTFWKQHSQVFLRES